MGPQLRQMLEYFTQAEIDARCRQICEQMEEQF